MYHHEKDMRSGDTDHRFPKYHVSTKSAEPATSRVLPLKKVVAFILVACVVLKRCIEQPYTWPSSADSKVTLFRL